MTAVEEIQKVQGQVAAMQSYLTDAQEILGVAEEVALAGSAVKRGFRRLILVPVVLLTVAALLIIWRKFAKRQSETVAVVEAPEST